MDQSVKRLNELPADQAEAEFLKCCGSTRWAKQMVAARPFPSAGALLAKADEVCWSLNEEDWLEAFRAHPKIGETKAAAAQSEQSQHWSAQEQSRAQQASAETKAALADGNLKYENRFGFIFIVCAAGRSSEEILSLLNSRIQNERATEIKIAADEQRKITRLRLEKLIQSN